MVLQKSKLALSFIALLLVGLISACDSSQNSPVSSTYSVDSAFQDFYREMGGLDALGPAISSGFSKDGISYQYVSAGLMVYDPNQIALKRFHFSPLASSEWKISGLVEPVPTDPNTIYLNGHQIWEEAAAFYEQFSPEIIGLPVTGVIADDAKQRYEQYFEGLGLYRNYTAPPGEIHLMPYGVWMCGSTCQYHVTDSEPPPSSYSRDYSETEQLFLQFSEQLGYGFTGAPLAAPHLGADGFYEMAFQNAILFINPSEADQVQLRPLPEWLGIPSEKPVSEKTVDWLSFYTIEAGQGFNVPKSFIGYINDHGGTKYSGAPIAEYHTLSDGGYSQCFTNLCLEYHPTAPRILQIRPHPLGEEYFNLGENVTASGSSLPDALQINAWEDFPLISSGQSQGINIEATQNKNPVSGLKFSLVVTQPNGISKTYTLSPTGADGKTHIDLDPINGPNGAIVQYEVCILGEAAPQICFSRSYTIWEQ